jgi:hypothetical protein
MVVEVTQSVNVSPINYRVRFVEDGKWFKLEEAEISASSLKLYYNHAQGLFSLDVKGEAEIHVVMKSDLEQPMVDQEDLEQIKNFGFLKLWDLIENVAPVSVKERELVQDMVYALEVLIKAKA